MTTLSKLYSCIVAGQVWIAFCLLAISALGVVIKHQFMIFFLYMALVDIGVMMVTCLFMGTTFVILRTVERRLLKRVERQGYGWLLGSSFS
jgi:hypothetical protein